MGGHVLEVDQPGQMDLQLGVTEAGGIAQLPAGEHGLTAARDEKEPMASSRRRVTGDNSSVVTPRTRPQSWSTTATSASVASM